MEPKKVHSIARRLRKISEDMQSMGLSVYGESGRGHLVHESRPTHNGGEPDFGCIVADVGQGFDGGGW